jgi:conjugal transfer/entry exclusion protein
MDQFLLYLCLFVSFLSFLIACNAGVRVSKVMKSTKGLEWDDIANLTGDIAAVKKTIQTLNNRLNGMNSPKIQEQELMMHLLNNQQKQTVNGKVHGG